MPRYTYLLAYDTFLGPHSRVKEFMNGQKEVLNWYYCIPNTLFVVTELTADGLANLFLKYTRKKGKFIILDTATDRSGWLSRKFWDLMKTPKAAGE